MQGASSKLQLYKSIVASFNIAWCSIMSGLLGTKKESHVKLDKTESGDGRTREEPCNLVSPQSNERNALLPATFESRPKMTGVYCIKESVTEDLYCSKHVVGNKKGRGAFKKLVQAYEHAHQNCFAEFPIGLFASWYAELPHISEVVEKVIEAATAGGAGVQDVWEYKVYFLHPMQVKKASPQLKARYNVAKKLASAFYGSIFNHNPLDKEVIEASLNVDNTVMVVGTKVENDKENAPKTGSKKKCLVDVIASVSYRTGSVDAECGQSLISWLAVADSFGDYQPAHVKSWRRLAGFGRFLLSMVIKSCTRSLLLAEGFT